MVVTQRPIRFAPRDYVDYLRSKTLLARVIHDQSVCPLLSRLNGRALELGAGVHDYSAFAPNCNEYIRSDYKASRKDNRIAIDATAIDFADASFDSVVCMSALEHIEDFRKVLSEVWRILRPGGRFLLCTPWVFPFHGAPNDYFRFSSSALQSLLSDYRIEEFEAVGNHWLTQAMFLQRPKWSRPSDAPEDRYYDPVLRMIGAVFMLAGGNCSSVDDNHALLYSCLCRKINVRDSSQ